MSTIFELEEYDFDERDENGEAQVLLDEANISWGNGPTVLNDISLKMKPGDFLTIIGQVGCGKSSILYSIMGETCITKGTKQVQGSIAYVEQEPFIYSASVKENILFGQPWDELKFQKTIQASQLSKDLEIFGKGADTVIGERGVNISGG